MRINNIVDDCPPAFWIWGIGGWVFWHSVVKPLNGASESLLGIFTITHPSKVPKSGSLD